MKNEHVLQGGPLDGRSFRYGGESESIGYRGGVYRRTSERTRTGCVWAWCPGMILTEGEE